MDIIYKMCLHKFVSTAGNILLRNKWIDTSSLGLWRGGELAES